MAKPRPVSDAPADPVAPVVTPDAIVPDAPALDPVAPVVDAPTPDPAADAPAPTPVPVSSPLSGLAPAGFLIGWIAHEIDSVPDENGVRSKVRVHTLGLFPVPGE